MADATPAAAPPRRRGMLVTLLSFFLVLYVMSNTAIRNALGEAVGTVLGPVIGFGGHYPVLTLMLAGAVMVLLTTLLRHFTTDWLEMAKSQAVMRHFQKEFQRARKENNTYQIKKLQDQQPDIMARQAEMSSRQMRTMPLTMIVVIPLFAWMFHFVTNLDYWYFASPWNVEVHMFEKNGILFGSSVFPHWILLYSALSIPLGALVQKSMKYLAWKERWQKSHPEVHAR
ncbi:MAG TPA: EMC3/TMCO1 family protein [Candidatus Thermoplasmatota archaeon]|nr:EMC3/TMCO1 family protein [Candidatus Thermoplasmatota archaeon]